MPISLSCLSKSLYPQVLFQSLQVWRLIQWFFSPAQIGYCLNFYCHTVFSAVPDLLLWFPCQIFYFLLLSLVVKSPDSSWLHSIHCCFNGATHFTLSASWFTSHTFHLQITIWTPTIDVIHYPSEETPPSVDAPSSDDLKSIILRYFLFPAESSAANSSNLH